MSALMPFLVLDQSCTQALTWVNKMLANAGLRSTQTFDLQVARLAHPDCLCPHHGSDKSNCRMVILLVYSKQEIPSTLIIQYHDGKSWISLAGSSGRHSNQYLDHMIRRILIPPAAPLSTPDETNYEILPAS